MTGAEIAEQLDYYGSWYDVNLDRDYAYINFATLSKFFDRTLAVAEQILLDPHLPRGGAAQLLRQAQTAPGNRAHEVDVQAREAFAKALFGARHPLRHLLRRGGV